MTGNDRHGMCINADRTAVDLIEIDASRTRLSRHWERFLRRIYYTDMQIAIAAAAKQCGELRPSRKLLRQKSRAKAGGNRDHRALRD